MEFLILLSPFVSYFLLSVFEIYIGYEGAKIILTFGQTLSMCLSIILLLGQLKDQKIIIFDFFTYIAVDVFKVNLCITFDSVTIVAITVINIISTYVICFSLEYMKEDQRAIQFHAHLSFFVGCMLVLVCASNLVLLFIGWELVGLCSYLLINHWFNRIQANKAGFKAILMNRFGDCFLLVAIILIWKLFGTFDLESIFKLVPKCTVYYFEIFSYKINALTFIGFALFMAAVGKSAQIGLHTWLADAMEGPTPVSALLHAATMVTAGVLLLVRMSPLLEFTNASLHSFILIIGSITAFFGASTALFQWDLKRIIAFSTCSQLGLMMCAIGVSNYQLALFHFSNHAFIKALLFLSAGIIIHGLDNEQDIRRMGALRNFFPLSFCTFTIGSLSLIGFPYTSGFYSKESIFEHLFVSGLPYSTGAYILALLASSCTAAYSVRLIYLVFFGTPRAKRRVYVLAHETSNLDMIGPIKVLTFFSIFIGYLTKDFFIGLGSTFFCVFNFKSWY